MTPPVLIVDDSLTVRMDLEQALAEAGLAPILAKDLAEAREVLDRQGVGLIVVDVLLPDGNGTDFVEQLKQSPATAAIPVLVLSTEAEVKERLRGLAIGADDFVGKPYDRDYLVHRAHELLKALQPAIASPIGPQVLVIDDSLSIREELRRAIEQEGFLVHTAGTGEDGLRLAARIRPDAIVVDSQLPGIDGTTVIRRLRADQALRGVPCLLLTGSEEKGAEFHSLEAGADTFMRKEQGTEVILARLKAMLRSRAAGPIGEPARSLYGPKKILAVDDSMTYLQALIAALAGEAYDVVPATSGEAALALLEAQRVDCVLLDLIMPGLSGEDVCRQIKHSAKWADVPVIMLTARDDREAMLGGFRAGADDFVCKSSEFELLGARLRAQLRRKQHEDENRHIREEMLRQEADAAEARLMRELAETRAALLTDLERSNKELEAFSYSVSHDLRSPLRAINGFVNIVLDDYGPQIPAEAREYLDSVRENTRLMGQLIDDLLEFSKLGRQPIAKQDVDLGALVADVVHQLRHDQKDRKIDLRIAELGPCSGDPKMLRQVLVNLIGNAIKYTGKRETAVIEIGRGEDAEQPAPVYFVKDNGAGFDPRFANKLFGVFQRLHRAEEFEGTGVGLAIVDRIVKRHGGRVWAESELGKGATFFFTLDAPCPAQAECKD